MFSQDDINTQICALCGGTNFYKESGYFFCSQCQTQNEDVREEVFETRFDTTTRTKRTKIRKEKLEKTEITGWTSWELYNLVLIGLTNELIEIGADPAIKLTVLQLWTYYLTKLEVAFISKKSKSIPRLSRRFHKKDVEIIYGKIRKKKQRRRKKTSNASNSSVVSSFLSDGSTSIKDLNKSKKLLIKSEYDKYLKSQASSDTDAQSSLDQSLHSLKSSASQSSSIRIRFNKRARMEAQKVRVLAKKVSHGKRVKYKQTHATAQYIAGPEVITPMKLWAIIFLALRIHNQNIFLCDMLRFGREGHFSQHKLDHLIPPEVALTKNEINFLTQTNEFTHKRLRIIIAGMAKFIDILEIPKPDIVVLIQRYCQDLNLPRGISLYAERLYMSSPCVLEFSSKSSLIPNYEGRAIAYIIVVLKVLLGLDDITEKELSRVAEKINRIAIERECLTSKLFSFCEWQKYIECRKIMLVNVHFPSKIKYDPECIGTSHLYLRFMGWLKSKQEAAPPEITNRKNALSQNLVGAMFQCIDRLNNDSIPMKDMELFPPSYTPSKSYIDLLNDNTKYDVPNILRLNFYESKIGYITSADSLIELAFQCGIKLEIIDHSIQFLEKIVPPFEQPRMPSLQELSTLVKVQDPNTEDLNLEPDRESLLDYSNRNRMCKMMINYENLKYYNAVYNKPPELDETLDFEEDSGFDQIQEDGRLNIPEDSDSEGEHNWNESRDRDISQADDSCLLDQEFRKEYNLQLYSHEIESLSSNKEVVKKKYVPVRDPVTGKYVKATTLKSKEYKRIKCESVSQSSDDEAKTKKLPKPKTKRKGFKKTSKNNPDQDIEYVDSYVEVADSDISIVDDEDVTILHDFSLSENEILFRPYRDYWMYHCIFSRVKSKNFELFEKELPENFLWLLSECANIVEMTDEDLYEQVCLIEAYHLDILKPRKSKTKTDFEFRDCTTKLYANSILKKW